MVLFACGCSAEPGAGTVDAGPPAVDSGPPVSTCSGDLAVVRVVPWPGGGLQIVLSTGRPDAVVGVEDDAAAWSTAVDHANDDEGITAVLVVGSAAAEEHAARLALAREILRAAPPRDRVAAWVAGPDGPLLLADATVERDHAAGRIAGVPMIEGAVWSGLGDDVLDAVRSPLAQAEGPWGALHRTLVVVGAEPVAGEAPFRPVATYFVPVPDESPAEAAADLSSLVQSDRDRLLRVGACPPGGGGAGPLTLRVGEARCELARPASASMAHLAGAACDPAAAASDEYPFGREIELVLTGAERAVLDDRVAGKSKEPFALQVQLGEAEPIAAEAHLHGHTSLDCDRKSYSVDLEGGEPRRLIPGAAGDRFFLLSLCGDPGYFRFHFANLLLADLGLFPLRDRYVVLRIDGVNQGVHLLVEQPEQGLRRDMLEPRAVIRRREDPNGDRPEVKYPDDEEGAADALARYDAIVELARSGEPDRVEETLDLESYLRWLAFGSLFEVGDFVDEAFFYAADEGGAWYFRTMAWDTKDIFEPCHHQGRWAFEDPCDLLYCAEADLDEIVVRAPAVYRHFLSLLGELSDRVTAERVGETMDRVRAELWEALADDETAAAMTELVSSDPAAADVDVARALIETQMDEIVASADRRRSDVASALALCPEATQ